MYFHPFHPGWIFAAVIYKNRSCSVSSGLSQLAFWVWKRSAAGHALHVCAPKSTTGEDVWRETLGKRKLPFSIKALVWELCPAWKLPASAECNFMSVLCYPIHVEDYRRQWLRAVKTFVAHTSHYCCTNWVTVTWIQFVLLMCLQTSVATQSLQNIV